MTKTRKKKNKQYMNPFQTILVFFVTLFLSFNIGLFANPDIEKKEVQAQVEKYFKVWSLAKIDEYGKLFHENAIIFFREKSTGNIRQENLGRFLESQKRAHGSSTEKMTEIPLEIKIDLYGKDTAQVAVYWKLTSGDRVSLGWDHFLWTKQDGQWKIVNLFFYAD